jgi:hypothetical protein
MEKKLVRRGMFSRLLKDTKGGDVVSTIVTIALLVGIAVLVFGILEKGGTKAANNISSKIDSATK